jgi:hypothetical protein
MNFLSILKILSLVVFVLKALINVFIPPSKPILCALALELDFTHSYQFPEEAKVPFEINGVLNKL